jgi:hypothetical protein
MGLSLAFQLLKERRASTVGRVIAPEAELLVEVLTWWT